MTDGPYTTITVVEYNHVTATIQDLRRRMQKARESLEVGAVEKALEILKFQDDTLEGETNATQS